MASPGKKHFALRIDPRLWLEIERLAAQELRSANAEVEVLLRERGIFHAKIHFSSGQVTLWSMTDPYNYQVYIKEEFLAPGFHKGFLHTLYPLNASVPPDR